MILWVVAERESEKSQKRAWKSAWKRANTKLTDINDDNINKI